MLRIPDELESKVTDFLQFERKIQWNTIFYCHTLEIRIKFSWIFDIVGNQAVNSKGVKIVLVEITGHKSTHFIVV